MLHRTAEEQKEAEQIVKLRQQGHTAVRNNVLRAALSNEKLKTN